MQTRHICPLQLEVIQRCIELWTNPNDIVLDPFAGIDGTIKEPKKREVANVVIDRSRRESGKTH